MRPFSICLTVDRHIPSVLSVCSRHIDFRLVIQVLLHPCMILNACVAVDGGNRGQVSFPKGYTQRDGLAGVRTHDPRIMSPTR